MGVADKPLLPHIAYQELLTAAEGMRQNRSHECLLFERSRKGTSCYENPGTGRKPEAHRLKRNYEVRLSVKVEPNSFTWFVVE
jgi:hypothetical protein